MSWLKGAFDYILPYFYFSFNRFHSGYPPKKFKTQLFSYRLPSTPIGHIRTVAALDWNELAMEGHVGEYH